MAANFKPLKTLEILAASLLKPAEIGQMTNLQQLEKIIFHKFNGRVGDSYPFPMQALLSLTKLKNLKQIQFKNFYEPEKIPANLKSQLLSRLPISPYQRVFNN
jgi:hypothetical protein